MFYEETFAQESDMRKLVKDFEYLYFYQISVKIYSRLLIVIFELKLHFLRVLANEMWL